MPGTSFRGPSSPKAGLAINNTPNHRVLHAKLAALEGYEDALVTASGMAAISGALLAMLKQGDHMIAQRDGQWGQVREFMQKSGILPE